MRTFERYLNRRNITDIKLYFANKGIETNKQLAEWCVNNHIEAPAKPIFDPPLPVTKPISAKTKSVKMPKATKSTAEETWHTPAAERPLRKPTKKPARTKQKKASK
jgi:hypothetical protein